MEKIDIIEALSQSGAMYILLILLKNQEMKTLELLEEIPVGRTAAYTAIRKLLNAELIRDIKEGIPVTRTFQLTEKGEFVAKKIREIVTKI